MSWSFFLPYVLVMAVVTYLIRMLPLAAFRRRITSRFIRSFLYYVPYAVLSAMTFPAILYATGSLPSACAALRSRAIQIYLLSETRTNRRSI